MPYRAGTRVSGTGTIDAALASALELQRQGSLEPAARALRDYVARFPADPLGHAALASVLKMQGDRDAARRHYESALSLNPGYAEAACNLGALLRELGDLDAAAQTLRRAVALRADFAEAYTNLGLTLTEMHETAEAIACLRRSLAIRPDLAETHFNLANALAADYRLEEAIRSYGEALALRPDYAEARWNLSHVLLLTGRFREGWEAFEIRWNIPALKKSRPPFPTPCWNGEPLAGKTLFVYGEQGFGDSLHFARYAPLAAAQGARVILHVPRELVRLMAGMKGIESVHAAGSPPPPFDFHCPVMSLPRGFRTEPSTIPANVPYLRADPEAVERWRSRLPGNARLKVGLVWSSGIRKFDHALFYAGITKSMPLRVLEPLGRVRNVEFFSLQKGEEAAELRAPGALPAIDWTGELHDFADTAALIAALDLVITVDTAVAHLAGALGRPVWNLVKFHGCWRWELGRSDSPWYPTMRLFRQSRPNDWRAPVEAAARELARVAESSGGGGFLRWWRRGR